MRRAIQIPEGYNQPDEVQPSQVYDGGLFVATHTNGRNVYIHIKESEMAHALELLGYTPPKVVE